MNGYATEIGITGMDMEIVLERLTDVKMVIHGLNGVVKDKKLL